MIPPHEWVRSYHAYRSAAWRFPNQYLGVVREWGDPAVPTLRFQAEAADRFSNATGSHREIFRIDATNIAELPTGGWYVDLAEPNSAFEFSEVRLACGTYRFTARVASTRADTLHLELDGNSSAAVSVPAVAATDYSLVHVGAVKIEEGAHRVRLVSNSGGANVDWLFLRRSAGCP